MSELSHKLAHAAFQAEQRSTDGVGIDLYIAVEGVRIVARTEARLEARFVTWTMIEEAQLAILDRVIDDLPVKV